MTTRRIVDLEIEGMLAAISASPSAVELARKILAALDAELAEARRIEREARNDAARGAR